LAVVITGLILLSACGDNGNACEVIGEIPAPYSGLSEMTDDVTGKVIDALVSSLKEGTGAKTAEAKAYLTNANFNHISDYYEKQLGDQWETRNDVLSGLPADAVNNVRAWSNCADEMVMLLYYEDVNPDGKVLVVIYAKP